MRRNPFSVPSFGDISPSNRDDNSSDTRANGLLSPQNVRARSPQLRQMDMSYSKTDKAPYNGHSSIYSNTSSGYAETGGYSSSTFSPRGANDLGSNLLSIHNASGVADKSLVGRHSRSNSYLFGRINEMAVLSAVNEIPNQRPESTDYTYPSANRNAGNATITEAAINIPLSNVSSFNNLHATLPNLLPASMRDRDRDEKPLWRRLVGEVRARGFRGRWLLLCVVVGVCLCLHWLSMVASADVGDTSPMVIEHAAVENYKNKDARYGILIDAGSSGSRLYVYQWPDSAAKESLENFLKIKESQDANGQGLVMKIEPGLSSFEDNISGAFVSLVPLLDFAFKHVPAAQHVHTPLYVLATAGLRLMTEEHQSQMIQDISKRIPEDYDFDFKQGNMRIISGEEEAMFAWVTANTLMGHLVTHGNPRGPTVGVVDMGGASSQIAFEIPSTQSVNTHVKISDTIPDSSVMDLELGDANYRMYAVTYLGFGANIVRDRYMEDLLSSNGVLPPAHVRLKREIITHRLPPSQPLSLGAPSKARAEADASVVGVSSVPKSTGAETQSQAQVVRKELHTGNTTQATGAQADTLSAESILEPTLDRTTQDPTAKGRTGAGIDTHAHAHTNKGGSASGSTGLVTGGVDTNTNTNTGAKTNTDIDANAVVPAGEAVTAALPSNGSLAMGSTPNTTDDSMATENAAGEQESSVNDPCLPLGLVDEHETYRLIGTGDFHKCRRALQPLLNITDNCHNDLFCAFNNMDQPQIDFQNVQFLGLSEFWYTLKSIFKEADLMYNSTDFEGVAAEFCATRWNDLEKKWENGAFPPDVALSRIRNQCFKSAWVTTTFHQGHGFPEMYQLQPVSKVNGIEMQWTLGAMLLLAVKNHKEMVSTHASILHIEDEQSTPWLSRLRILYGVMVALVVLAYWLFSNQRRRTIALSSRGRGQIFYT